MDASYLDGTAATDERMMKLTEVETHLQYSIDFRSIEETCPLFKTGRSPPTLSIFSNQQRGFTRNFVAGVLVFY